ncbi:RDD family protein [Kitasatospora sp. NPDC087315]|uniref:RDD family protein n=1 Tax=Kitasatospora sp. NPDC087315 TaxID=3364069 RepID=UPI00382638BD
MTDRPFVGGTDTAVGPAPGYYPDPSIPGFVRYWGGTAWVPGTSRPAPAAGEVLEPPRFASRRPVQGGAGVGGGARFVPPPVAPEAGGEGTGLPPGAGSGEAFAAGSAVAAGETGPVYLDQTEGRASFSVGPPVEPAGGPVFLPARGEAGASAAVGYESVPSGWQVDPRTQRGLLDTGDAPRWVSWGVLSGAGPAPDSVDSAHSMGSPDSEGFPELSGVPGFPGFPGAGECVADERGPAAGSGAALGPVPGPGAASGPGAGPVAVRSAVPAAAVPGPVPASAAASPSAPSAPSVLSAPVGSAESVPVVPPPAAAAVRPAPRAAPRRPTARRRPTRRTPAGPGRRLAARLVDTAVLAVVAAAAGLPLGREVSAHLQRKLDQARMASVLTHHQVQVWLVDGVVVGRLAVLLGILAFVGLLYEVLPTARTGQTFGKRLARIRVVDAAPAAARARLGFGRSLLRWTVGQLAALLLIGLVWPLLDRPARRGWQDRAARTRVVRD